MGKRMTDTDKWKKPFIKSLPPQYKLFWFYILDDCNISGVWEYELDIAELRIGMSIDIEVAKKLFEDHIIIFDNGKKWCIKDFIPFQNGDIILGNSPVQRKIIDLLKSYKINDYTLFDTLYNRVVVKVIVKEEVIVNKELEEIKNFNDLKSEILNSGQWMDYTAKTLKIKPENIKQVVSDFMDLIYSTSEYKGKDIDAIKRHFTYQYAKKNENKISSDFKLEDHYTDTQIRHANTLIFSNGYGCPEWFNKDHVKYLPSYGTRPSYND